MANEIKIKDIEWQISNADEDTLYTYCISAGCDRLTVLHRRTGFGPMDTETGFLDTAGRFWLASGMQDVRDHPEFTIEEAIEWVKKNANTCVGE